MLRMRADKTAGTFELTGGDAGMGFCALHFISDPTNIHIYANPEGIGGSCDYNDDKSTNGDDWVTACLKADSLEAASEGSCDTLAASRKLTIIGRDEAIPTAGMVTKWEAAAAPGDGSAMYSFGMTNHTSELFEAEKRLMASANSKDKKNTLKLKP